MNRQSPDVSIFSKVTPYNRFKVCEACFALPGDRRGKWARSDLLCGTAGCGQPWLPSGGPKGGELLPCQPGLHQQPWPPQRTKRPAHVTWVTARGRKYRSTQTAPDVQFGEPTPTRPLGDSTAPFPIEPQPGRVAWSPPDAARL